MPQGTVRRTRRRRPMATVLVLALVLVLPTGASAQSPSSDELREELERTQREGERRTSELDSIRTALADAEEELATVTVQLEDARARLVAARGQVSMAEIALTDAEAAQADAEAEHDDAERLRAEAEAELAAEEGVFAEQVVNGFKYGSVGGARGSAMIDLLRHAEDPIGFSIGMRHLQLVVDDQGSTVERVTALRLRRSDLADDAARARGRAVQLANEAAVTLRTVEQLRADAEELAEAVTRDELRQRDLVAGLRGSAGEVEAALVRVEAREAELRESYAAQRRREEAERAAREAAAAAADGRLGLPGAAGGPDVPGGIVCPVVGAVTGRDFINDWGFPRSGGRTHQGNDLFAVRGTSVVAVADGVVVRMNSPGNATSLGGITVTYRIADGSEWYNAHLDTIAAGIAPGVSVGRSQVIGTVGSTGNARTTPPHLHLGRRVAGSWVNPYPTIGPVCR